MYRRDFVKGVSAAVAVAALGLDITENKAFLLFYISSSTSSTHGSSEIPTIDLELRSIATTTKTWREDVQRVEEEERERREKMGIPHQDIWVIPLRDQLKRQNV